MTESKRGARLIGALLILHLILGLMLPYILLHPVARPAGAFLDTAAAMSGTIRLSMLMLLAGSAFAIAIALLLRVALGERHRELAALVVVLSAAGFVMQLLENAQWLSLMSLSQSYAGAAAAEQAVLRTVGLAAYATWRWVHYSHILVAVLWLLSLYVAFYRAKLVPRLLGGLAIATVPLHLIGIILPVFAGYRMVYPDLFGAPLGLVTIGTGLWLLAKRFGRDAERAE